MAVRPSRWVVSAVPATGTWVRERPIGVFDSGLGGLTVLQALADLLPSEDLLYLGDTARYPYGDKPIDEVRRYATENTDVLMGHDVKMVVVACNSATAAALPDLRDRVGVPVIGVVEPGLRAAASTSRTGHALVLATTVTAESEVYERAAAELRGELDVSVLACPGLVELVEEGRTEGPEVERLLAARLAPRLTARTDTLVLGCTHFPLLARPLSAVVGRGVTLVSSADETAFEVRSLLERTGWRSDRARPGRRLYLTSGDPQRFRELGEQFLGQPLGEVVRHPPEAAR